MNGSIKAISFERRCLRELSTPWILRLRLMASITCILVCAQASGEYIHQVIIWYVELAYSWILIVVLSGISNFE